MHTSTLFLVFAALITTGFGIKCYVCNSNDHEGCKDPFKLEDASSYLRDCGRELNKTRHVDPESGKEVYTNYTFCRKTTQKASLVGIKAEDKRVVRSCGYLPDNRLVPDSDDDKNALKCYRKVGTFEVEMLYCACYADECNPAARPEPVAVAGVVAATVLGMIFTRWF
ncbi:uncharacterized protein LOC110844594 [Folsomia candida]|uniref:Uncharacterized protein n=1 Tax=Folsomia candida TaxID=158441 RepID=A0A226EQE1_FOLCA|nr:uncharacterized protein LOC110844594 [Folsomia candida]OXA59845.1 hypothetical protein Fcan01_04094 [Folsomia candida]